MSAGVFKDCFIDCDGCGRRLFGSHAGLGDGMTVASVRKVAKRFGWKTSVENTEYEDEHEIRRGPRLDYCGPCVRKEDHR